MDWPKLALYATALALVVLVWMGVLISAVETYRFIVK